MHNPQLYHHFLKHSSGVCTDTRKLRPGEVFFALKGPNFNGNQYAAAALEAGASLAVVDEEQAFEAAAKKGKALLVEDVLQSLQELARSHRRSWDFPVVALTGSNGKTTTRELMRSVLSRRYRTHATQGNLNNHIGVPLTLLACPADAEIAVIEMGANHQKEIAELCSIALPSHGLVTNVGKAHLEGFGGVQGVIKGKGEMYDYLAANRQWAFVNMDEPHLSGMAADCRLRQNYGREMLAAKIMSEKPFLTVSWGIPRGGISAKTQLTGRYNFPNILTAIAVGRHFEVPDEEIKAALEAYVPENNRTQWLRRGSNTIIMDAYNANPTSMRAALDNFFALTGNTKVAVLGDMLELGAESHAEHRAIMEQLQKQSVTVFTVGPRFMEVNVENAYPDVDALLADWDWGRYEDALFLLKGSRGIRLEKMLSPDAPKP